MLHQRQVAQAVSQNRSSGTLASLAESCFGIFFLAAMVVWHVELVHLTDTIGSGCSKLSQLSGTVCAVHATRQALPLSIC